MREVNNLFVALSSVKNVLRIVSALFHSSKWVFLIWRSYIIIIVAYHDFDAKIFNELKK